MLRVSWRWLLQASTVAHAAAEKPMSDQHPNTNAFHARPSAVYHVSLNGLAAPANNDRWMLKPNSQDDLRCHTAGAPCSATITGINMMALRAKVVISNLRKAALTLTKFSPLCPEGTAQLQSFQVLIASGHHRFKSEHKELGPRARNSGEQVHDKERLAKAPQTK